MKNTLFSNLKPYIFTFVLGILIILNFSSCDANKTDDLANLIGGGGDVIPGTNDGVGSDGSEFYVAVDKTVNSRAHVRSYSSFSTNCSIPKSATASTDLDCIIDVPEGDIYAQGLSLTYNVPAGMCRYLNRYPYFFWTTEVGYGPSNLIVNVYSEKTTVSGSTSTTYRARPDCIVEGVTDVNCDNEVNTEVTLNYGSAGEITTKCIYDHSGPGSSSPNCCFGSKFYAIYDVVSKTTDGVPLPTETTLRLSDATSWGAKAGDCIGGPGRTNWELKSTDGVPNGIFVESEKGYKQAYKVTPPYSALKLYESSRFYSTHIANFYKTVSHTHDGIYASSTVTTLPYAIAPIDDRSGSLIPSTHPAYTFECRDAAWEILHRINVYVRDWDTLKDYEAYISSKGTSGTPDRFFDRAPTSTCDGLDEVCNDMRDLDDIIGMNLTGVGSYITTPASATSRSLYFPQLVY